jgi:lipopolysaccharide transport system ATP-binding protein
MSAPAIRVEEAGKWYRLGTNLSHTALLSEQLGNALRAPFRRARGRRSPDRPDRREDGIWAVRDVTFELHKGEALGLIGRNGAGKSTLLKLLSRITLPTHGRLELRGRIATLLEVGTGFHPELTGRENIYLNGAVLGMRRAEIAKKYDEIVEFSGVERFLETPVKRYSSGMFVRLGFAVAAHLDPDVLLVDEVLAVGDAEFQRKCLGKMREAAGEGRAVIFVSHNLAAVQRLCSRALLIEGGRIKLDGSPDQVVERYMAISRPGSGGGVTTIPDDVDRIGSGEARLRRVVLHDAAGNPVENIGFGQPLRVTATYEVLRPLTDVCFEVGIFSAEGTKFATAQSVDRGRPWLDVPAGWYEISAEISFDLLLHEFHLGLAINRMTGATIDWVERAQSFTVSNDSSGDESYQWPEGETAYVRPESRFTDPRPVPPPGSGAPDLGLESVPAGRSGHDI